MGEIQAEGTQPDGAEANTQTASEPQTASDSRSATPQPQAPEQSPVTSEVAVQAASASASGPQASTPPEAEAKPQATDSSTSEDVPPLAGPEASDEPEGAGLAAIPAPAPLAPAPDPQALGMSKLELKLRKLDDERSHSSRFLPWLTVATGAGISVAGTAVGAAYAFDCEGGCDTPPWIGMIVVTGTLVATLGAIWVVHADADVRELDSRRYHLKQEIERLRLSSRGPADAAPHASPLVSWRFALR